MILVGNQRGGAKNLAQHLLKDENDRVTVHQVRGFASDDLQSAFQESYAMSRATKCKQHLFSLSLNPPHDANLSEEEFEETVDRAEQQLGLEGQPRAIVLHTKNGRTHAHAVWSRINTEEMRAVQMSFTRLKMQDLSRELYREHGWQMPRGFMRHEERDPRNFTLAEWQQCKRAGRDPKKTKEIFQDAWAVSDSKAAFASALKAHGFILARGDRRGHIAVDHDGEAYPVSRYTGLKAKQVRDRLGKPDDLPNKSQAHEIAVDRVKARLFELSEREERRAAQSLMQVKAEQDRMRETHRAAALALERKQASERALQLAEHQKRFRKGVLGLVDRFTGRKRRTAEQNRIEQEKLKHSHAERKQSQKAHAKTEDQRIQEKQAFLIERSKRIASELKNDTQKLERSVKASRDEEKAEFKRKRIVTANRSRVSRGRNGPDRSICTGRSNPRSLR